MTPDELDELREELLRVTRREEWREPADPGPSDLDELHARNVRIHGRARADYARWKALLSLADYLRRCEERRQARAMLAALEELERARQAEVGAARWLKVAVWLARRVDETAAALGRRCRVATSIDFSPSLAAADYGETIEELTDETDDERGEIKW